MKVLITLLLVAVLFIAACSSGLTGGTVVEDSCSSLEGMHRDNCYFEKKKCSKIERESVRNVCVAELGIQKQDWQACDLTTSESAKGFCQFGIAKAQNNVDLCPEIQNQYWRDNCFYHYATNNNQVIFCAAISAIEQQQDCFWEVAIATNNPEVCASLPTARANACIFKIAQATANIQLCDKISGSGLPDTCRLRLASKILKDESFCQSIKLKDARDLCYQRFKE